jgi:hypothetical protein
MDPKSAVKILPRKGRLLNKLERYDEALACFKQLAPGIPSEVNMFVSPNLMK